MTIEGLTSRQHDRRPMNLNGLCSAFLLCTRQLKLVTQPQPDQTQLSVSVDCKKNTSKKLHTKKTLQKIPTRKTAKKTDIDSLNYERSYKHSQDSSKSDR